MKRTTLSLKKPSIVNGIKRSQARITSFFTKVPKPDINDINRVTSDIKSLSQAPSIDKKRKERNDSSEEEFYTDIKKKCITDDICTIKSTSIESCENSLVSATDDLKDTPNNLTENELIRHSVSPEKCERKETSDKLTVKTEYNEVTVQNCTSSDISECKKAHILQESQDQNTVQQSALSPVKAHSRDEIKSHDPKKVESLDGLFEFKENDFDDLFDEEFRINAQINLTTTQRCKIIDVRQEPRVVTLKVRHVESEAVDTVACSGLWKDSRMKVDDIVMIQARQESRQWVIDNNGGFLVIQPDILISSTTVTSGVFCTRRTVLAQKFRRIESLPCPDADYSVMTVGSLVHQWFQKALQENVRALSGVIKLLDGVLRSKDTINYLYASEMSLADCRKRMMEYAPRIFEFIQHYIGGNKQQAIDSLKDNFRGSICDIQDIEENICIPQLGIQGRVDVTTEVNINPGRRKIMPLEVKTGRASYSLEHKAQMILYLMMMGSRDEEIDVGLLLYLKENSMREVRSSHHERRDLLILRNTLAHYFRQPEERWNTDAPDGVSRTMELPEPISHPTACLRCPYSAVCCAYLARDPDASLAPSHPLTALVKRLLDDFEPSHLDYVIRWIALLQLMESSDHDNGRSSSLWTTSPEKREAKGTCISNLQIVGKVAEQDDRYRHVFARVDIVSDEAAAENSALSSTFAENDYVIVSTDTRINIAAGNIFQVSKGTVSVLLDKNLARKADREVFHVDKYFRSGSVFTFDYANIAGLLSTEGANARLRRIVVDRPPATFAKKLPRSTVSAGEEVMGDLNEDQQRAVLQAVAADEYVLVKGMPGTGKTQTLVVLIELLLKLNLTVLITAHTHSAVDNVLLKLSDRNIDFLRLGATKQIHPLLTCKTEEYATRNCDTPESLETLYNEKRVVGVTCYGAYHPLLRRRSFDVCVVDESTQVTQPTVLRPLYSARRFVLVGDPDQLPPVVRSRAAVKLGADESLFTRLDSENNTVSLTRQYRMNGRIMKLANDTAYRGKLAPGDRRVENATLTGGHVKLPSSCEGWVRRALSGQLDDSVMVLDTGSTCSLSVDESCDASVTSDQIYSNVWEAAVVARLVRVLVDAGVHARNVGIIAPYNAHVTLLRKIVDDREVEVNTVDQYQGRDKDVILYTCARSVIQEEKREFEILDDQRRLTVAITRAKHKLLIIADKITVMRYTPFKNLFAVIDEKNVMRLHDGEGEFNWKSLVRSIL